MQRRYWVLLSLAAAVSLAAQIGWAHPLAWDEVEFFRAAKWVGEGRVPFRDFWEHHLPLQWILFAPLARFVDSPGAAAIVAMRVAQVPFWIGSFFLLRRLGARALPMLALLASPLFVESAVEFRVDVVANLAFLAALVLALTRSHSRAAWIAFGALGSLGVLANIRLVYLIVPAALVCALVQEGRWRFNPRSPWLIAGVIAVAVPFIAWLQWTGAMQPFREAMELNVAVDRIMAAEANTLVPLLLRPFRTFDIAAILIIAAAIFGAARVRDWRTPGVPHVVLIVAVLSAISVVLLGVHYSYHLQLTLLLLVPLIPPIRHAAAIVALLMAIALASLTKAERYDAMRYQDAVMRAADAHTRPGERVWDGVGSALRREPAYRYWFLASVVRIAAERGMIDRYDARAMIQAPPAAIVHSIRVNMWLRRFPDTGAYATRHYVPLYRDLWLPALSAPLQPRARARWVAPREGRYRLVASDVLVKHPWFSHPLNYALVAGSDETEYEVELAKLPRVALPLAVDGKPVSDEVFELRKGARVEVRNDAAGPVGVLIVPEEWTRAFISPPSAVVM